MKSYSHTYESEVEWVLSYFSKANDSLLKEVIVPVCNDNEIRELLGYKNNESLVGEHPVNEWTAKTMMEKFKIECDTKQYDLFIGARAVSI